MTKKISLRLSRTTLRKIDSTELADVHGRGPGMSQGQYRTECCGNPSDEAGCTKGPAQLPE